ncbi:MAG TPA: AAA family ATPase [Xanthobacteraceae bacterium]|nr:AAA family ATPase [Xanthobacteraceae bacterium]
MKKPTEAPDRYVEPMGPKRRKKTKAEITAMLNQMNAGWTGEFPEDLPPLAPGETIRGGPQSKMTPGVEGRKREAEVKPNPRAGSIEWERCSDGTFYIVGKREPSEIDLTPWHVQSALEKGKCFALIGPGGTGKSLFNIVLAVIMATGKAVGPFEQWKPLGVRPRRTLLISGEDDRDEFDRRVHAVCTVLGFDREEIGDYIRTFAGKGGDGEAIHLVRRNAKTLVVEKTELWRTIYVAVRKYNIEFLSIDPLISTHLGFSESNNEDMTQVIDVLKELIAGTECSLLITHHTSKAGGSEDMFAARGASAIINACRGSLNFFPMSETEHRLIRPPKDRRFYAKAFAPKQNYAPPSETPWFEKVKVPLRDGDSRAGLQFCGWEFAKMAKFEEEHNDADEENLLTGDDAGEWPKRQEFLDKIAAGLDGGNIKYTRAATGPKSTRAESLLMDEFNLSKMAARSRLEEMIRSGVLIEKEYAPKKGNNRRPRKGLFVAEAANEEESETF